MWLTYVKVRSIVEAAYLAGVNFADAAKRIKTMDGKYPRVVRVKLLAIATVMVMVKVTVMVMVSASDQS